MPLEIRELVVRVTVAPSETPAASLPDPAEMARFKREVVAACVAELRQRGNERNER